MSLFDSLGIGYSGLTASQVGISVTGNNIANANTEGYVRQRIMQTGAPAIGVNPGMQSTGVKVTDIERVFDQLTFDRYYDSSATKANSDYEKDKLEILSTFFPEIDDVGVKSDLHAYFDLWQSLADNPDSDPIKVALAQQTQTLSTHISQTRDQVRDLQIKVNNDLELVVNEINGYAKEIAALNKSIGEIEADEVDHANDLRDRRNYLELKMSELASANVLEGQIKNIDGFKGQEQYNEDEYMSDLDSYTMQISGFNIVDGATFHPIGMTSGNNEFDFHQLYYELQNGNKVPMEEEIIGGKLGAILDIRGRNKDLDEVLPSDGVLPNVLNELDVFAKGLIEATNNIYAKSATDTMQSNTLTLKDNDPFSLSGLNIFEGSFNVVIYDIDGNEVSSREIIINETTTLKTSNDVFVNDDGTTTGNSIMEQLSAIKDDNGDNNSNNDVNSFIDSTYTDGQFSMFINQEMQSLGYTFAIVDKTATGIDGGTNFAGALGMSKYFDGDSAHNITLDSHLKDDPTKIQAYSKNVKGNNDIALDMVQMQFEQISFKEVGYQEPTVTTVYDFFDKLSTGVGSISKAAIIANDTITAQYNATKQEYESVSGVSIDEELTNLIKYQTAYGAAAKVITTVDQMMTTLLGIKS